MGGKIVLSNPAIGDIARDFHLRATSGELFGLGSFIGKPVVLLFCPSEASPDCARTLLAFRDAHARLKQRSAAVAAVAITPAEDQTAFAAQNQLDFPLLCDSGLKTSALFGVMRPKQPQQSDERQELSAVRRTVVLAADHRIARIYENPQVDGHVEQVLGDIEALFSAEPPRRMMMHAPVLLVPDVLPADLCARLIQVWHEEGSEDSGFMRQVDGKTVGQYDYAYKIRRDHFLRKGPELETARELIGSRVVPRIKQAFDYSATRFEDFRIACYDSARGGYFRPHRDNTTEGTSHRRFAMSLLLNEDYGGGTLRFPEFGLHEYRPGVGGAVVFSCSLVHEATDVTAGRRFVLLSFFYGEKEAQAREEYNKRTGGIYRAGETEPK